MPFVPVPNTAAAELVYAQQGQVAENTLYFRNDGGWTPELLVTLASSLIDWWTAFMATNVSNQTELIKVTARDLTASDGATAEVAPSTPLLGTQTGDPLPANCAYCVTFITGVAGRSFRGRNYVTGLVDAQANASIIQPAARTAIINAYQELQAAVEGDIPGAVWAVVSRFAEGAARSEGLATTITGVVGDIIMDSQRRRLPGRGK